MRFYQILIILSIILIKQIFLIRTQSRTNPLDEVFCEDVCTDGRNCLTDEWFVCKWRQLFDPQIICCFNRKTDDKSSVKTSVISPQNYCQIRKRSSIIRRGILSFFQNFNFFQKQRTEELNYPWMVSVQVFGRHVCGGSVLSDYAVLTSAHCFVPFFDSSVYRLRIGFNDSSDGRELTISKIIRHELYFRSESYHDIAIIVTTNPIQINGRTGVLCLPSVNVRTNQIVGQSGTVLGFTYNQYNRVVLKQIKVRVVSNKECAQKYGIGDKHNIPVGIQDCMLCAITIGSIDANLGDSGGPLIVTHNGIHYILGIVSFGRRSGAVITPGVYTNVIYYSKWIFNKLSQVL